MSAAGIVRAAETVAQGLAKSFEQRVRESGALAFQAGIARRNCPAHKGSAMRTYWLRGYDSAKRGACK